MASKRIVLLSLTLAFILAGCIQQPSEKTADLVILDGSLHVRLLEGQPDMMVNCDQRILWNHSEEGFSLVHSDDLRIPHPGQVIILYDIKVHSPTSSSCGAHGYSVLGLHGNHQINVSSSTGADSYRINITHNEETGQILVEGQEVENGLELSKNRTFEGERETDGEPFTLGLDLRVAVEWIADFPVTDITVE